MHFAQIYVPGLAHCSYVLGSGDKCVVVDPARKIKPYLDKAESFGMDIVGILETHLHADFVSGHMDLAEQTGAEIYAPEIAHCSFSHTALKDGDEFTIGSLRFKLLETPGHTPDCAVYVVTDLERGEEPVMVFSGDTLLVGDVGRPDLFPDQEEALAEKLFDSLKKLKDLPDHVEVYPAHGMGSLCGRSLSAKLWSTIGIEKKQNYALKRTDLAAFKEDLLTDMPPAPDHFARCSEINRQGPEQLAHLEPVKPLDVAQVQEGIDLGHVVLDTRSYLAFAAGHIPNSYSISLEGNLATFAGWVIPPEKDILLVLEQERDLPRVADALYSVGLDHISGYLQGGIVQWINAGAKTVHVEPVTVDEIQSYIDSNETVVLDNRAKSEWKDGQISGTTLAPTPDVRHRHTEWDVEKPIVTFCNTSNRSMTAASILKQKGFKKVMNFLGGTTAWKAAGYEIEPREEA